jgi:hypothetical protein
VAVIHPSGGRRRSTRPACRRRRRALVGHGDLVHRLAAERGTHAVELDDVGVLVGPLVQPSVDLGLGVVVLEVHHPRLRRHELPVARDRERALAIAPRERPRRRWACACARAWSPVPCSVPPSHTKLAAAIAAAMHTIAAVTLRTDARMLPLLLRCPCRGGAPDATPWSSGCMDRNPVIRSRLCDRAWPSRFGQGWCFSRIAIARGLCLKTPAGGARRRPPDGQRGPANAADDATAGLPRSLRSPRPVVAATRSP